ncbi:MAG: class I SAM-dependent methyltransferase [Thermoanaerobaculia bacterium]
MTAPERPIRDISDTARWAALYRARESERKDALFRDPLARRLAGERGEQIDAALPFSKRHTWSWVTRTYLFDDFIAQEIERGADLVVNLAAGLDARPYRMALPPSLRWVEVDLPELIAHKEEALAGAKPACALRRIPLDLADVAARRALFAELGRGAERALVVSEGLIIYLTAEEVGELARDLAAPPSFRRWVTDLVSPGLLKLLQKKMGPVLDQASAPLKFAPEEGVEFFARHGWRPVEVRSMLHAAAGLGRLPLWMRFFALFPPPQGPAGARPWSGVCLLEKSGT